jgi:HlyD family secretion protein
MQSRPSRWSAWIEGKRPRLVLAGAGAVLVATTVALTVAARRGAGRPERPAVTPLSARKLVETGDLRSAEETPVFVMTSGEIIWLIDEGAQVEEGDVVLRIDETTVREQLEEEERQLLPRRKELERAESELEAARTRGTLVVRLNETKLDRARWSLEDIRMRPTPEELTSAQLDLRTASVLRDKTSRELARVEELAGRGLATETELRTARLDALNAGADAGLAELSLDVLKSGSSRLSIESARLSVEKAKLEMEEAAFLSEADVTIAEKAVEIARSRLAKHERQIERRQRDLRNCQVRAPVAGRVAFVEVWKGTSQTSRLEIGETCRWGQLVCKMADPRRMEVRVFVNEVDALRLREGQRANARLTAFPGTEMSGRVSRIGVSATDKNERLGHLALRKAGQAGVNVVEVTIELDGAPPGFRGGYTATVEIDLAVAPSSAEATEGSVLRSSEGVKGDAGETSKRSSPSSASPASSAPPEEKPGG